MHDQRMREIREAMRSAGIRQERHLFDRRLQRRITIRDVEAALLSESAECIIDEPHRFTAIVLAWIGGRPLHVVVLTGTTPVLVKTVYDPSTEPERWSPDFRRRIRP